MTDKDHPYDKAADLTLEQMQAAMKALTDLRVAPGAVFAFATALEAIQEAKDAAEQDPEMADYSAHDHVDACCEAELDDGRDEVFSFYSDVHDMVNLIQGEKA